MKVLLISLFVLNISCATAKNDKIRFIKSSSKASVTPGYRLFKLEEKDNPNQEKQVSDTEVIMMMPMGEVSASKSKNKKSDNILDIDPKELTKFIKKVKKSICVGVEEGDVKVWISAGVDAKVFGIGTSGESGIEVSFKCKKKNT